MIRLLFTKITYALIAFTLVFGGFFAAPAPTAIDGPLSIIGSEVAYAGTQAQRPDPAIDPGENEPSGGVMSWLGVTAGIKEAFGWIFSSIFGMFLAMQIGIITLAGLAFDTAIDNTIVDMGGLLRGADGEMIPGILVGWSVLRDVSNIIFIFTLVFIGIATILGLQTYGWRSLMVRLIIAALLINFSMLIARVVIDTSNLIGSEVYTILKADDPDGSTSAIILNQAWAVSIFDQVTPFGIGGSAVGTPARTPADTHWQLAWKSFFMMILLAIMTFVFFAAVFMLVARFVILIFLMIVSPIAFAAMILPQTRELSNKWWHTLFYQSFFAPAYLLMLWIALMLMDGIGGELAVRDVTFAELTSNPSPDSIHILLYFTMIAGLMVAALIIASRMGAYGANTALALGQRWSQNTARFAGRMAGNATLGSSAYVGRRTIGAVGARIADNKTLKDAEAKGTWGAKSLRSLGIGASKTSFDVRQVGGVGNKLGIGEGAKGGIAKSRADRVKAEEERTKELEKEKSTQHEKEKMAELNKQKSDAQSRLGWKMQEFTDAMNKYGKDHAITKDKEEKAGKENTHIQSLNKTIKQIADAKEARGMARKGAYADTLERKSQTFTRKWITGTAPALAEAADTVRKSKSDLAKFQESLKKANKEIADQEKAEKDKSASGSSASGGTGSGSTGGTGGTTTP